VSSTFFIISFKLYVPVRLNLTRLLQKHIAILAMSGAGKSYLTSVLIEELLDRPKELGRVGVIIFDVHGEYLNFAEPVDKKSDEKDYSNSCKVYNGNQIKIGVPNLNAFDFQKFSKITDVGIRELEKVMSKMKKSQQQGQGTYNLKDIIKKVEDTKMAPGTKNVLLDELNSLYSYHIFNDVDHPSVPYLIKPGKVAIIDLSGIINTRKKQIIVSYLLNELFSMRMNDQIPPFFAIIEEAHQFAPGGDKDYALTRGIIERIAREGRKFHASIGLITQRPKHLSTTALSQCNSQIILRVTNPNDLKHIGETSEGITAETLASITSLPVGEGLIVGEAVNHPIFVRIRKRRSQESGKGNDLENAARTYEDKIGKKEKDAESYMP